MDVFEFLADTRAFVDRVLSDEIVTRSLPEELVGRYRSRAYSDGYRERYPNFDSVARSLPALSANLRTLHAAGVPVALGTDMWAFPGLGVSIEMDLYVRAGLSPLEAIRCATQTAARCLAIDHDRGTLESGKRGGLSDPVGGSRARREGRPAHRGRLQEGPGPEDPDPVTADPLPHWRTEFPILETTRYLISNSLGAMPRAAARALAEYAETWGAQADH